MTGAIRTVVVVSKLMSVFGPDWSVAYCSSESQHLGPDEPARPEAEADKTYSVLPQPKESHSGMVRVLATQLLQCGNPLARLQNLTASWTELLRPPQQILPCTRAIVVDKVIHGDGGVARRDCESIRRHGDLQQGFGGDVDGKP